jgi:hypothetical protein
MATILADRIAALNSKLAELLAETRRALSGQSVFGPEQVRALLEPIDEMAPVMKRAPELRALEPAIATHIDLYRTQLAELQTTLEHVRIMLVGKRAQMEARRGQLDAVAQWAAALRQTR